MYSGNGRSGHYIAERKKIVDNICQESQSFYEFNDYHIYKKSQQYSRSFADKAFLYEKIHVLELNYRDIECSLSIELNKL
jgi:hypothetical protein